MALLTERSRREAIVCQCNSDGSGHYTAILAITTSGPSNGALEPRLSKRGSDYVSGIVITLPHLIGNLLSRVAVWTESLKWQLAVTVSVLCCLLNGNLLSQCQSCVVC